MDLNLGVAGIIASLWVALEELLYGNRQHYTAARTAVRYFIDACHVLNRGLTQNLLTQRASIDFSYRVSRGRVSFSKGR